MKTTDKFLLGIVISIVVLVAAAVLVTLLQPAPAYQEDGTPEAAAHNYLLALQLGDNARAYQYLSPFLRGYPDSVEEFTRDVDNFWNFRFDQNLVSQEIVSSIVTGNWATVQVKEIRLFNTNGLVDSTQSTGTFDIKLQRFTPGSGWKITDADRYWNWCWENLKGCH